MPKSLRASWRFSRRGPNNAVMPAKSTATFTTSTLPTSIEVAVSCVDLPLDCGDGRPIYLAVQRGAEVVDITPASARKADFILPFRLGSRDGAPNFLGPYAQGTVAERFFYLSWGTGDSPTAFGMFRRLKVHLSKLAWLDIKAAAKRRAPLRVRISMTDRCGMPFCASAWPDHPAVTWNLA